MGKRSTFLASLLITILIGGAIYYFGHMQLEERIDGLRAQRYVAANEAENFTIMLDTIRRLDERIPVFESLIAGIAELYTRDFEQAEYILFLKSFLDDSDITLNSFNVSTLRGMPNVIPGGDTYGHGGAQSVMGYNSYRLTFNANIDQLLLFLGLIETSGRGFASSNLQISSVADSDNLNINTELRFYYLADMEEFTMDYEFDLEDGMFNMDRRSIFE